jgi:hypothetical protein
MRFLLLFFLGISFLDVSGQRHYKLDSDRPHPDFIFRSSLGYIPEGDGYQNKVSLEYYKVSQFSFGASLNYLLERFKDGPSSFEHCGSLFTPKGRSTQERIYLSLPFSLYFGKNKFEDIISTSFGPLVGYHNYPKEFIQSRSGFLFTSPCTKVVYTRNFFIGIDAELMINIKFGARSGFFIGGNFLILSDETPRKIIRFGYLIDIF